MFELSNVSIERRNNMQTRGRTGEKVQVSGVYKNNFGKQVTLIKDDLFPACPKEGKEIEWQLQ
jgi:phage protein U